MDTSKTATLLDRLDDEIDDLEEALEPLTGNLLAQKASKMPVLDKAKLYVLSTYAIESMLFCAYSDAHNAHLTNTSSIPAIAWRERKRPPSLQGVDSR